jgi:hypothetical protein
LFRCYLNKGKAVTDKDNRKLVPISPHGNNSFYGTDCTSVQFVYKGASTGMMLSQEITFEVIRPQSKILTENK